MMTDTFEGRPCEKCVALFRSITKGSLKNNFAISYAEGVSLQSPGSRSAPWVTLRGDPGLWNLTPSVYEPKRDT
jgi:hypothetical protein